MGTFSIGCKIENLNTKDFIKIHKILVDTGAEHTWIKKEKLEKIGIQTEKESVSFIMANGQIIKRDIGFMLIRVNQSFTVDEVVFATDSDLELLGARSLEGLNLSVDTKRKKLVASGPHPVA